VGEATNRRQRGENRQHGAGNWPTLAINGPGCDDGSASKTVSEIRPEITAKSVKISNF
jgi:hypothetical protein